MSGPVFTVLGAGLTRPPGVRAQVAGGQTHAPVHGGCRGDAAQGWGEGQLNSLGRRPLSWASRGEQCPRGRKASGLVPTQAWGNERISRTRD